MSLPIHFNDLNLVMKATQTCLRIVENCNYYKLLYLVNLSSPVRVSAEKFWDKQLPALAGRERVNMLNSKTSLPTDSNSQTSADDVNRKQETRDTKWPPILDTKFITSLDAQK